MADDAEDQESRTEEPSSKRREEFHQQGQIAYSREVGMTANFASMILVFSWVSAHLYQAFHSHFRHTFMNLLPWKGDIMPMSTDIIPFLKPYAMVLGVVLAVAFVMPLIAHIVQKGWEPKYEAAMPSVSKLNPISGISQIFSKETLVKTAHNFLKTFGMMIIFYTTISPFYFQMLHAAEMPLDQAMRVIGLIFSKLLKNTLMFFVVLATADYFIKWRMMNKKMMMTRQELKDEGKEQEGNPEVKAKIKSIQRQNAKRKANKEVPQSTVVITNPTHFAVAIKYKRGETDVPMVTVKGNDYMALKIRELAKEHRVPVIENPPLARALYRDVSEGQAIPNKYFKPVAKIIAAIMRIENEKKMRQQAMLSDYRQGNVSQTRY